MVVWFLILWACRFGTPPRGEGYFIGKLQNQGVEFGVDNIFRSTFLHALSQREAIGSRSLHLEYLQVDEKLVSIQGQKQQWEIFIRLRVWTEKDRELVIEDKESYNFQSSLQFADSRQQAYRNLSSRLARRAVDWLLFAPTIKKP